MIKKEQPNSEVGCWVTRLNREPNRSFSHDSTRVGDVFTLQQHNTCLLATDCWNFSPIVDTVYINTSNAKTSGCQSHGGSFQLCGHHHRGLRQIFIFNSHSDLNLYFENVNLSPTALLLCFCCFIFPRDSSSPALLKLNSSSSLENFCFCSLHDSRLGFSLVSGFCTYSVLPNSFSLNVA